MSRLDSGQALPEFASGVREADANDPFIQWLRDDKSGSIDWNTFGIEKIQSKEPRKLRSRHSLKQRASSGFFPSEKIAAEERFQIISSA